MSSATLTIGRYFLSLSLPLFGDAILWVSYKILWESGAPKFAWPCSAKHP